MRTGKELYQVFEDNQHLFYTGLCMWASDIHDENLLTWEELLYILDLIDEYGNYQIGYYWGACQIKPRLEWLKQTLIK